MNCYGFNKPNHEANSGIPTRYNAYEYRFAITSALSRFPGGRYARKIHASEASVTPNEKGKASIPDTKPPVGDLIYMDKKTRVEPNIVVLAMVIAIFLDRVKRQPK